LFCDIIPQLKRKIFGFMALL